MGDTIRSYGYQDEARRRVGAAVAGWNKVLTLLEIDPELKDPDQPVELPRGPLSIDMDGLVAGYEGSPVLRGVDVAIPAGCRVAVVGETGSGKTTFARVLCRLVDPMGGSIRLGGVELANVSTNDRHRSVQLVPQDGFLFDTSVAENIRFGREGATDADVRSALADLGLDGWVGRLPEGADTAVGPRGEHRPSSQYRRAGRPCPGVRSGRTGRKRAPQ